MKHNDDKVIPETGGTAGKLLLDWQTGSRPHLLINGCLLIPDWNIGSKRIFKFENSISRGKPEEILESVVMVVGDDTIRYAKG